MRWLFGAVLGIGLSSAASNLSSPKLSGPTYHQDIAPIIERSCLPCHRKGDVAPFALETYQDVKSRAKLVQIQVLSQAMPPHRIQSDFGPLAKPQPVTDEEAVKLQTWIRNGALEGQAVSKSTPHLKDWRLGAPDAVVLSGTRVKVPEEGAPYWQLHMVDLTAYEDRALTGVDLRPKSPQALRSASFGFAANRGVFAAGEILAGDFGPSANPVFGGWAPGFRPWRSPPTAGLEIPPGRPFLAILTQYRPTGKQEDGGFEVALYFRKGQAGSTINVKQLGVDEFAIEANKSLVLESDLILEEAASVLSVVPVARFFASRFQIEATLPDGSKKTLFETLRWNPYWAGGYCFDEPPTFPKGTRIVARVAYDNDERCLANEGKKPQRVVSGPKLTDELFRVHLVFMSPSQHN